MIKVFSVAEMIAAEKASDAAGNSYDEMMEKAGRSVAEAIIARYPVEKSNVTILVGPGNNGGDGLVAGRYLAEFGADVTFYMVKARDPGTDHNLAMVEEMGLPVLLSEFDQRHRVLRSRLAITDILLDALLGTGVSRPVTGNLAKLMKQVKAGLDAREAATTSRQAQRIVSLTDLNREEPGEKTPIHKDIGPSESLQSLEPTIVAVDCPSGLNCDTGALDNLAFPANLTVTFAGPKRGHFMFPGAAACGEIIVADIDISVKLPEVASVKVEVATAERARSLLPERRKDGHKGTFGWVMIAAGSGRYWGAAALAGRAAYRAGAGLVALAVPALIRPTIAAQLPEATYPPIADEDLLSAQGAKTILEDLSKYTALLVGPGLHKAKLFMQTLLESEGAELPSMIVDADGLNLLAEMTEWYKTLPNGTVLTPHLGEMARLMGVELSEAKKRDRVDLAQEKAAEWGCIVLLKGAYSVIAAPDGRCTILPFANPALATAGSGDVLSGVIVALLGQAMDSFEAAVLGGYLHAAAAQMSGIDAGLLAGEIADWVPEVIDGLKT